MTDMILCFASVAEDEGRGNHRSDRWRAVFPYAFEGVNDMLPLDLELVFIRYVLVVAASASFIVRAYRNGAMIGRAEDVGQRPHSIPLFGAHDFGFNGITRSREGDKHNVAVDASDSIATEGDIVHRGDNLLSDL